MKNLSHLPQNINKIKTFIRKNSFQCLLNPREHKLKEEGEVDAMNDAAEHFEALDLPTFVNTIVCVDVVRV